MRGQAGRLSMECLNSDSRMRRRSCIGVQGLLKRAQTHPQHSLSGYLTMPDLPAYFANLYWQLALTTSTGP